MTLILVTNKELAEFTNVELEEQAEYADLYVPYKYGVVFRERVYVPGNTTLSFHVRLRKGGQLKSVAAKEEKKGTAKKDAQEDKLLNVVPEKNLEPHRRIKVELIESGETVFEKMGYNHLVIPHVKLQKTEELGEGKLNHAYILQCSFDISDWPNCIKKCEETADVGWVLKVISSASVGIVKDTEKEDREQVIRESWEEAEPGRAEKAKQSRAKFMAKMKKMKGEALSPEEEELAKDDMSKKKEEKWGLLGQATKKVGVKEVKKQAGKAAPAKQEAEPEALDLEKPLPEPAAHINSDIKEYLDHSKHDRLIVLKDTKHKAKKRTPEEIEQIKQKHETEIQNFDKYLKEKKDKEEQDKKEREEVNF
jgi:hypothetical protein